ncbi:hypothetical protein FLA105534_01512 [Flavobacterium bizetiae]|uniref:Uncharacterized protein n=1 Tax=Flavobacterium bizetiae TaxID=2704140 RepID=A0A6J4GEA5_9FLAO|nr:hypothetical protein FLA105534_01512 [Flavobacterium bizetiae]CAD5342878.1 hypothetical protein FLA105535_02875 [Flavobacterium bizetiae]CAD5349295.1 hypothetical protein FLA105534_03279 [Flavobacterium bizetiae]
MYPCPEISSAIFTIITSPSTTPAGLLIFKEVVAVVAVVLPPRWAICPNAKFVSNNKARQNHFEVTLRSFLKKSIKNKKFEKSNFFII